MPRTSKALETRTSDVLSRRRAGNRPTLASLYGKLDVPQRNNLWGWSGRNEATNTAIFQIDWAQMRLPTEFERSEGIAHVHEMTVDDHKVWRELCIAKGRQLPERRIGWRKMREDLSFARGRDSSVRAIMFSRKSDGRDDGPKQCRNWEELPNCGRVVAFDETSGSYKIVFFKLALHSWAPETHLSSQASLTG